jgi:nucleoside-diphosphate-sugar epimerase
MPEESDPVMRVLFVGGTGNISAECAAWLHARGCQVSVVSRGRNPVPAEYEVVRADRHDVVGLRSAAEKLKPDVVLNFLGYELEDVHTDMEVFGSRVRQYIFISSTTVYAKPHRQLPLTETTPLGNMFWDYAQKKLACEQWLLGCWREKRFPVTIVRPSHTYSKRWIPNPVASSSYNFAARIERGAPVYVPDDGETPWTLTAASDFAVGLGGLVGNAAALGEVFHITSDEVLTWNQIYAEIAAALGVAAPVVVPVPTSVICRALPRMVGTLQGDKANPGVFDNSKIKRFVPGFSCRKSFREGVRESVSWLRANPDQQNLRPELEAEIEAVLRAAREEVRG